MPSGNKKAAVPAEEKRKSTRTNVLQVGKYDLKNLKFLGDFMTKMHLSTTAVAEKAGLTQVAVYYWLKKDDAHLSSVENLLRAWGFRLVFDLVPPNENDDMIDITIELPEERRLAFLESAISGINRDELQKKLGIGSTTIYYWLSHDDIFISYIFKVADVIGKKVKISIRPL